MGWQRWQLKDRAKAALKRSYWSCVLVALIMSLVGGAYSSSGGGTSSVNSLNRYNQKKNESSSRQQSTNTQDVLVYEASNAVSDSQTVALYSSSAGALFTGIMGIVLIVIVVIVVIAILLKIFAYNPLIVGGYRFFIENADGRSDLSNLVFAFRGGRYSKVVKTMFERDLFRFLWSCLLVIPGIIKGYEYCMIPYLLASDTDMTTDFIFKKTKEMTNGEKWNIFVLGLSFIGWDFLGGITFGIVRLFFVEPYKQATMAELFLALGGTDESYLGSLTGFTYCQYELNAPAGGYAKRAF